MDNFALLIFLFTNLVKYDVHYNMEIVMIISIGVGTFERMSDFGINLFRI